MDNPSDWQLLVELTAQQNTQKQYSQSLAGTSSSPPTIPLSDPHSGWPGAELNAEQEQGLNNQIHADANKRPAINVNLERQK